MNKEELYHLILFLLLMRNLMVSSKGMAMILLSHRRYLLLKLWLVTQDSWRHLMGGILQSPPIPSSVRRTKKLLKERVCQFPRNLPKRETWGSSSISSSPLDSHQSRKPALNDYWHHKRWWCLSLSHTKSCKIGIIFTQFLIFKWKFFPFSRWFSVRTFY